MRSIVDLPTIVDGLPGTTRELFDRIFEVFTVIGLLKIPDPMTSWIIEKFGSIEAVRNQRVVRATNLITGEQCLFNELRSQRPILTRKREPPSPTRSCAFCQPLKMTPSDVFGRVHGQYCVTASNIGKYDGCHGVLIFDKHDPWDFDESRISDHLETATRWFSEMNRIYPNSVFPFYMQNMGSRGGASIPHGHAQLLLSQKPYKAIDELWEKAESYKKRYGSDYFRDLSRIHLGLGLGTNYKGVQIFANLTPVKEREIVIVGKEINLPFKTITHHALKLYRDMGAQGFNLAIYLPPLVKKRSWIKFPTVLRLVDRGLFGPSDIGAMEIYAGTPVITSDPFKVAELLKHQLKNV